MKLSVPYVETGLTAIVVKPCGCIVACMVENNGYDCQQDLKELALLAAQKGYILKRLPTDEATEKIRKDFHSEGNCPHMPVQSALF